MNFTAQTKIGNASFFQNLETISALKQLTDESAATCSGGAEAIKLYDGPVFGFLPDVTSDTDINDLSNVNFNNRTSSVRVDEGVWRLFPGKDFSDPPGGSKAITLYPGNSYTKEDIEKLGLKDNTLSSIQRLRVI